MSSRPMPLAAFGLGWWVRTTTLWQVTTSAWVRMGRPSLGMGGRIRNGLLLSRTWLGFVLFLAQKQPSGRKHHCGQQRFGGDRF